MRVALVHDWLDNWGGGEVVLSGLLQLFPNADVFMLVDFLPAAQRIRLNGRRMHTTPLQHVPGARRFFRYASVLWPQAMEGFDLSGYDLIFSDSHSIAKGVRKQPGQLHVCYCHSPARFAWAMEDAYINGAINDVLWKRSFARRAVGRFRNWDLQVSQRVDSFIANSQHIAASILHCYGRSSKVIHPGVEGARFAAAAVAAAHIRKQNEFVTVSRLVSYKRIDLMLEAFRRMPQYHLTVIGDGPERRRLLAMKPPNVTLAGWLNDEEVAAQVATSRAFIFAAEEDFGIAPVEAQAAGIPVLAYAKGGALETVRGLDHAAPTGVLFGTQTPEAICKAVEELQIEGRRIAGTACMENAARFTPDRFRLAIRSAVADAFESRLKRGAPDSPPAPALRAPA